VIYKLVFTLRMMNGLPYSSNARDISPAQQALCAAGAFALRQTPFTAHFDQINRQSPRDSEHCLDNSHDSGPLQRSSRVCENSTAVPPNSPLLSAIGLASAIQGLRVGKPYWRVSSGDPRIPLKGVKRGGAIGNPLAIV
jgi:hypothetical protein